MTNLFIVCNNLSTLFSIANNEVNTLSSWITANKLFINYDKTNYMLFQPYKFQRKGLSSVTSLSPLAITGHVIQRVHVVKYLGIYIDENLTWLDHISYLMKKISSLTGILYRVKSYLPIDCKKQIYYALANSSLIYCIEIYANVNQSVLNPLIIKCNRLLRLLQSKPRRTPINELYAAFGTLPVDKLFQYYTLKLIHKCVYNSSSLPVTIAKCFVKANSIHSHGTRRSGFLYIHANSNPNSVVFYGPNMWNKLPLNFQNDPFLLSFLKACKDYLLCPP